MGVTIADIVQLPLTRDDVLWAIAKAQNHHFIDNLRKRDIRVQFDSKVRGYLGELAFKNWLISHNIIIVNQNTFNAVSKIDVDLIVSNGVKNFDVELKTSLIPDKDKTLENVLLNRDIKLIKRKNQSLENLPGDIHIQLIFNQKSKAKDEWLMQKVIDIDSNDLNLIYHQMAAWRYLTDTCFVGWIDKQTLLNNSKKQMHDLYWSFKNAKRDFWRCPLKSTAQKPLNLLAYLKL